MSTHETQEPSIFSTNRVLLVPDLQEMLIDESDDMKTVALHHNRGMSIYQTRLITPLQPHKAKTLSR